MQPKYSITNSYDYKPGRYIVTLRKKVGQIIEIFPTYYDDYGEYGDWRKPIVRREWRLKVKFFNGEVMNLDPQFGSLPIVKISKWNWFLFFVKRTMSTIFSIRFAHQ